RPRQAVALQQFENAAEQFATMKRRGDEFIAVAAAPAWPARELAGKQSLEPRLPRPQPAHRANPVESAGEIDRGDDQSKAPFPGGPQASETFRHRGNREPFLGQNALDRLPPTEIVVDYQNVLPVRVHCVW